MSPRPAVRPGGRSARVRQSVHAAVRELLQERGRDGLTVPLVAARAGVTPSTVYRRWGTLRALLADVAVERLRPGSPPADLGSLRADLESWATAFAQQLASPAGRAGLRDAVAGDPDGSNSGQCAVYAAGQIETILSRAAARGEHAPDAGAVLDHVVAPLVYRALFRQGAPEVGHARALVATVLYRLIPLP
ncbi:TetR/AcrR family transcriptional regulator [Streptomyces sp. PR69]|uniref:TetR/AcrR family transcriptional regulator n=1 Tax=Streptomyces sp. PR69 TaxID=2984950 RepID=UPI002263D9DF|nr:TetR/AcrR family transcriptional regulator [Streptomyces sp. PR69]